MPRWLFKTRGRLSSPARHTKHYFCSLEFMVMKYYCENKKICIDGHGQLHNHEAAGSLIE